MLSVIGPHSGCGKTTLVIRLLHGIRGLGCLKISPAHTQPDDLPRGVKAAGEHFYLEDPPRLNRPGKDTALYLAAGAAHVERLRHWENGLSEGLVTAIDRFPPETPIVVESSSAVRFLNPAAVVLVIRPPIREMKPATRDVLPLVTDLLVNASDGEASATDETERLRHEFPALNPPYTWSADLLHQPPPNEMVTRLRNLLSR